MKINLVLLTPNEEDITYLHYKNPCGTVRSPQQHSSWDSMCTSEIPSPSPELAIKITHFTCLFITQFQYYMYTDDQLTQICVNCFLEEMIQPPVRLECGGTSNAVLLSNLAQHFQNRSTFNQLYYPTPRSNQHHLLELLCRFLEKLERFFVYLTHQG